MHAQIQNEGAPGSGGRAELTVHYRAAGSQALISRSCEGAFPPLDTKDVAEIDCTVLGKPPIYSNRIVRTSIQIRPAARGDLMARRSSSGGRRSTRR